MALPLRRPVIRRLDELIRRNAVQPPPQVHVACHVPDETGLLMDHMVRELVRLQVQVDRLQQTDRGPRPVGHEFIGRRRPTATTTRTTPGPPPADGVQRRRTSPVPTDWAERRGSPCDPRGTRPRRAPPPQLSRRPAPARDASRAVGVRSDPVVSATRQRRGSHDPLSERPDASASPIVSAARPVAVEVDRVDEDARGRSPRGGRRSRCRFGYRCLNRADEAVVAVVQPGASRGPLELGTFGGRTQYDRNRDDARPASRNRRT